MRQIKAAMVDSAHGTVASLKAEVADLQAEVEDARRQAEEAEEVALARAREAQHEDRAQLRWGDRKSVV